MASFRQYLLNAYPAAHSNVIHPSIYLVNSVVQQHCDVNILNTRESTSFRGTTTTESNLIGMLPKHIKVRVVAWVASEIIEQT